MADRQSMTNLELVRSSLLEEHGDFLKEAVATVAAQLIDAETRPRSERRAARCVRSARRTATGAGRGRGRRGSEAPDRL